MILNDLLLYPILHIQLPLYLVSLLVSSANLSLSAHFSVMSDQGANLMKVCSSKKILVNLKDFDFACDGSQNYHYGKVLFLFHSYSKSCGEFGFQQEKRF